MTTKKTPHQLMEDLKREAVRIIRFVAVECLPREQSLLVQLQHLNSTLMHAKEEGLRVKPFRSQELHRVAHHLAKVKVRAAERASERRKADKLLKHQQEAAKPLVRHLLETARDLVHFAGELEERDYHRDRNTGIEWYLCYALSQKGVRVKMNDLRH